MMNGQWSGGWLGALLAAAVSGTAQAQQAWFGQIDGAVSGMEVVTREAATGDSTSAPIVSNTTSVQLRAVSSRPRLTVAGELRLGLSFDSSRWAQQAFAESAYWLAPLPGDMENHWGGASIAQQMGTRVVPQLDLGIQGRPTEWLGLSLLERTQGYLVYNDGAADYARSVVWPTFTTDLGNQLADPTHPGLAPLSTAYLLLPADSWTNDVTLMADMIPGLAVTPSASAQYVLFRQLECLPYDYIGDGIILSGRNFNNDSIILSANGWRQTAEQRFLGASLRFTRDDNRPLEGCAAYTQGVGPAVYYQVNPGIQWTEQHDAWKLEANLGGLAVWGRARRPDGQLSGPAGLDFKPVGTIAASWHRESFDAGVNVGTQVATLLGQPTPTYNVFGSLHGTYRPRDTWALTADVSFLQSLLINEIYLSLGGYCMQGARLASGAVTGVWHPVDWFSGQVGYSLAVQSIRGQAGCEGYVPASTEDSYHAYDQVLVHSLSIIASFKLDGGFERGFLPTVAGKP